MKRNSRREMASWRRSHLAICVLFTLACGEGPSGGVVTVETDSAGITLVSISGSLRDVPEWFLEETVQMTVSGAQQPYIGSVGVVGRLSDGRVVIEDHQADQLHLFKADGSYVRTLAGRGDGPGEFQDVGTMSVGPGDTLYVYDRRHGRLSVLHPDDGFLRSLTFTTGSNDRRVRHVWAFGPDRFVVYALGPRKPEGRGFPRRLSMRGYLYMHDGQGEVLSSPVVFSGGFWIEAAEVSTGAAYSNQPVVAVGPRSVVHASGSTYALTVRNDTFVESLRIRWPERDESISPAEADSVIQVSRAWYTDVDSPLASTVANLKVAILPDIRPPLGRTLVDDVGRIWISRFEPLAPGWPEPREWHVLDVDGHPIGRVTLPDRVSLLAVSETSVMLLVRDSLDVETVEVRRIVK